MANPTNRHHSPLKRSSILTTMSLSVEITVTPRQFKVHYSQVEGAPIRSEIFSHFADNKKAGSYVYI
jgi:hypothetical protein